jgi:hypothetical protein
MDKIQKILIETGHKDLAQEYYKKVASDSASKIAEILNKEKGQKYAANWTGATDKAIVKKATEIKLNRGKGLEKSVKVEIGDAKGFYIYMPPFEIDSLPTDKTIFVFKCNDAIFIEE